jgi:hypothetical protein
VKMFSRFCLMGVVAGAGLMVARAEKAGLSDADSNRSEPRLAVIISVDQMRADYLTRFEPFFGLGGFRRMMEGGAWFEECRYRHAVTKTAVGHATISTGVYGNVHGIVGNEWIDLDSWEQVNAVEDRDSPLVGARPKATRSPGGLLELKSGRSPRHLWATTVGDQLKLRYGSASTIVSVSHKDRAAILLGGKSADEVYWMEDGRFVTSTYYRAALPDWAAAYNATEPAAAYFGRTWDRVRPVADYDRVAGPDDAAGEMDEPSMGRTFPKTITGGEAGPSGKFFDAVAHSPWDSEI